MRKKIFLILISVIAMGGGIIALSAFESQIINVTAHIENALKVLPSTGELSFGTVFPQQHKEKRLFITTSESFCQSTQRRVLNIDYQIVQKPKCVDQSGNYASVDYATHQCPPGFKELPLLCSYLSKIPVYQDPAPYTDRGILAFHDLAASSSVAMGTINKDNDLLDEWIVDLATPCFKGECSQDWPDFVFRHNPSADPHDYEAPSEAENSTFGCDLWIEPTKIY